MLICTPHPRLSQRIYPKDKLPNPLIHLHLDADSLVRVSLKCVLAIVIFRVLEKLYKEWRWTKRMICERMCIYQFWWIRSCGGKILLKNPFWILKKTNSAGTVLTWALHLDLKDERKSIWIIFGWKPGKDIPSVFEASSNKTVSFTLAAHQHSAIHSLSFLSSSVQDFGYNFS